MSCTAGVRSTGEWIRLFPVPYRLLSADQQFRKYQEVDVEIIKAVNDQRPESFRLQDPNAIEIIRDVPSAGDWAARWARVSHLDSCCMCCLRKRLAESDSPTLGFFEPFQIDRLEIAPGTPNWTDAELAKLRQLSLSGDVPPNELEKIPFKFKYHYRCPHSDCNGHAQSCTDWEMAQAFRSWRRKYQGDWESKFREKFEEEMIHRFRTRFFVGTVHNHPNSWLIVGLWYPPRANSGDEAQQPTLL